MNTTCDIHLLVAVSSVNRSSDPRRSGKSIIPQPPPVAWTMNNVIHECLVDDTIQATCHFLPTFFNTPGTYFFCYANQFSGLVLPDYKEVPILTIAADEKGLTTAAFEREGGGPFILQDTGQKMVSRKKACHTVSSASAILNPSRKKAKALDVY